MEQDEKYQAAKRRVAALKDFYVHLLIYASVMALLFLIDVVDGGPWWFYWPLFGWGIAVAIHAIGVFGAARLFGAEWEERKIQELVQRK